MVPAAGLEPARPEGQQILSLQRLPIPPRRHLKNEIDVNTIIRRLVQGIC
jgi:hypothetical protein